MPTPVKIPNACPILDLRYNGLADDLWSEVHIYIDDPAWKDEVQRLEDTVGIGASRIEEDRVIVRTKTPLTDVHGNLLLVVVWLGK